MLNNNLINRYTAYYCGAGKPFASKNEYAGYVACLNKLKPGDQLEVYFDQGAYDVGALQTNRSKETVICDIVGRSGTKLVLGRKGQTGTMWSMQSQNFAGMNMVENWRDYKYGWWIYDIYLIDCVLAKSALRKNT